MGRRLPAPGARRAVLPGLRLLPPHLPWYAPEKYFAKFPEAETLLPAFLEADLDDTPPSAGARCATTTT